MAADTPISDVLREHLRELGRKGGHTMSAARQQSLAKARAIKDFYRRHPDQHPKRKQEATNG